MIFGIGVDICQNSRFKIHLNDYSFINRFFNEKEIRNFEDENQFCEYYSSRFAAKEAFSKALGTGIKNFSLKDLYVAKDKNGKPEIILENSLLNLFNILCPQGKVYLSISHEKENAVAFVVIDQ